MTATATSPDNTEVEGQDEVQAEDQVETSTEAVLIDGKNVAEMSQEEILATLTRRRTELAAAQKVAKERGIKVPKSERKAKQSDVDQLDRLFNRLGYSTGMRRWADGRMDNSGNRIQAVVEADGAVLQDPERLNELLTALAEGYREAKIQTSFSSAVMDTKEAAKVTPVASILPEALESAGDKVWDFLAVAREA